MKRTKEDIKQIGLSISSHATQENKEGITNRAFARAKCVLSSASTQEREWTFWLTNKEDYQGMRMQRDFTGSGTVYQLGRKTALQSCDGQPVYKNTRLGEVLTKYVSGTHSYNAPGGVHTLEIINRSAYKPTGSDPSEVEIRMANDPAIYRYQRLSHLLNAAKAEEARLKKQIEELKRIEEEKARLARELEEKKAREEQARIEALRIQKEEEERKMLEEIARIEQAQAQLIEQEKAVRSFMRKNVMLRSQHLLDQYQEDAKRSHIYDNIPIVIDGGPGTGKTTTMIQRLKFLLSYQALEEYEAPITKEQLEELTDETERDNHWLFFSPTELLLQYLRDNMREEGLRANDRNTRVVGKFRNKIMRDYQLFNPSKDGPFKDYKPSDDESALIRDAKKAILEFERFIIDYCNKTFSQRASLKTDEHIWHQDALRIKNQFARSGKVKDIDALMRLFNSLHDNEKANVKSWSEELRELLKASAMTLQRIVSKDEEATVKLKTLFEKWRKERVVAEETDDEEEAIIDDDDDDTEEVSISRQEFDAQLFLELKKLIKKIGLKKYDSKIKFGKHSQDVLDIVGTFIDEEELDVESIGSIALFVRNYASLCRRQRLWTLEDLRRACEDALYEYEGITSVSKRTTQRDIELMRSDKLGYNAPIIVKEKKYYTYEDPDFSITQLPLSKQDLSELSSAMEIIRHYGGFRDMAGQADILARMQDKIQSNESHRQVIYIETNNQLKGLDFLSSLYDFIVKKQAIEVIYRSFKAPRPTCLFISPYILKEYNNRWFLVGYNHRKKDIQTIALDRIYKVVRSNRTPYVANTFFDPEQYFGEMVGVTRDIDTKPELITIRVDADQAPYIITKPLHHSQQLVERRNDGSIVVTITVIPNHEIERLILGYGRHIEVLAPSAIRAHIAKHVSSANSFYQ